VPPPKPKPKPCCTAGDVGCPAPEPNPNGFGAGCCGGALVGPPKENGTADGGAKDCAPNAGLAGADPNAPPLTDEPNAKEEAGAGGWAWACPKANPLEEDVLAGSGAVWPNVKLVECWIDSGALKENPEDVASAVFGPAWLNANPLEDEGLLSVAG
jgi:hypothetical protein